MVVDAHEDGSLSRKTRNKNLGGDTCNPIPILVPHEEVTINGQLSSTNKLVVVLHVSIGVQTEIANDSTKSTRDFQHSVKKEEDSKPYDIDESSIVVPILDQEDHRSFSMSTSRIISLMVSSSPNP